MFCRICENFMDITNNVSIPNTNPIENILTGGAKTDDNTSSDYDVSSSDNTKRKKGHVLVDSDIEDILNGKEINIDIEMVNINNLNKISYFNKLNSNQKTLVINRLYEKLPKNQKIPKTDVNIDKDSYFYCKNCGYNEKIPPKMFIFSRSSENNISGVYTTNFTNLKYDNTLPTTKKYNCINKECKTHKNPNLKNAVFYRYGNTYAIRYICTVCDNHWSTSTENL